MQESGSNPQPGKWAYVIITPAHNEEAYIEDTLRSVVSQSVLPRKWVIVSDGSTDRTDEIVGRYAAEHRWIEPVTLPPHGRRNFAAKVNAVNAGQERLSGIPYDFLCSMDADISFDPDYFEYLLRRFDDSERLGIAGTDYVEGDFHSFRDSYISDAHVNGQCQMFRIECWRDIGGYRPIRGGGIDTVAVRMARMRGWETRSLQGKVFRHLRPMGSAGANVITSGYRAGHKDYILGNHPLWQLLRGLLAMSQKPYVLRGVTLLLGYFVPWALRREMPISKDLIRFHRKEQMVRLSKMLKMSLFKLKSPSAERDSVRS